MSNFSGATLMITGGTGSFGRAALQYFLSSDISQIRIFSRDEKKQDDIRNVLKIKYPDFAKKVKFYIGDIRNIQSIKNAIEGVDYIFHAAALKQVPSCELFPIEAVQTNVIGTENLLNCAIEYNVKKVVCLSTDKAVYPVSTMGLSKAIMEHIVHNKAIVAANKGKTIISSTRYGNVLCTRGSIVPLFVKQIKSKQPITITNPNMTRFLMDLDEAILLVKCAFENANPGDLFIQKTPSSTIGDLAKAVQKIFGDTGTKIIGTRYGDKLYETLMTKEERARSIDIGKYFNIKAFGNNLDYEDFKIKDEDSSNKIEDYTSINTNILNVDQIVEVLLKTNFVKEKLNNK